MSVFKHILVAYDGSSSANRACERAVELAEGSDARLTLLQVIEPSPYLLPREVTDGIRSMVLTELEQYAAKLKGRLKDVRGTISEGRPWEKIVEAATGLPADLVVMGTHGRSGLSRAILGSVAERVVRLSPVPVLTVPDA